MDTSDRAVVNRAAERVLAQLRANPVLGTIALRRFRRGVTRSPHWKVRVVAKRKAQRRARGVQRQLARRARKRRQAFKRRRA